MSNPLNIAVVGACPYPVPQGSQVYLRNTALALRDAGHGVHLVTYGYGLGEDPSGLPLHRAANPPFARRTAAGPSPAKPLQDALLARTLARVIRERRIDLVNAHNYEALAVALAVGKRPIVYHAHNAFADELPHFVPHRGCATALGRWLDSTLPRRADLVVTPHERLRGYLMALGCPGERIHTVPPPIDFGPVAPSPREPGSPALLYAGNLDRYQNLNLLGPVMRRVHAAVPEAQLVVATSETRSKMLLRAAELGRVVRADSLAAALEGLPSGAIFVCPRVSWSGFPVKLLNAMAAGLPIVSFQSAGHPLTHTHDALLVPDGDAQAFAEAVVQLLRNGPLRVRLGATARRTVEQIHSRAAASARLDELVQNLSPRPK